MLILYLAGMIELISGNETILPLIKDAQF